MAAVALVVGIGGCRLGPRASQGDGSSPTSRAAGQPSAELQGPRVVFLGDSLTAGHGLDGRDAFPAVLGRELARKGLPIDVINAGVSGDTSDGGLARLSWLLAQKPAILVLELGANDGLRGLPTKSTEANLRQIMEETRKAGACVLLVGMKVPPSLGPDYAHRFDAIYPRLARELKVPLVPFLLAGVAGRPALNQADGIHPTARGQELAAGNVLPFLERMVRNLPACGPD